MRTPFWLAAFRSTYFYMHSRERLHIPVSRNKKWAGRRVLSREESNEYIESLLSKDEPFFLTRLGGTECEIIRQCLLIKHGLQKTFTPQIINFAKTLSGIFPNTPDYLMHFSEVYLSSISNISGIGIWYRPMEDYIIQTYAKSSNIFDFYALYPGINQWTKLLKGKKVLVVHPFAKSIKSQYAKRESLFPHDPQLCPAFDLLTYKTIVSLTDEIVPYENWEDALIYMFNEIKTLDFDICLLGCGAYGLPLGRMIYDLGKQVIHVGGSLQLLFGITGNLYSNYDLTKHLMNECWVFPLEEETPSHSERVENSMYWRGENENA